MKNILLGFLMATCMFLMIGASDESIGMLEIELGYMTGLFQDIEQNLGYMQEDIGNLSRADFTDGHGRFQMVEFKNNLVMINTQNGRPYIMMTTGDSEKKWKWQDAGEGDWFYQE